MGRAILVTGDLARNISDQYNIDRRRTASLLDIFSCVMQGLLPYSAQLLLSASFAAASGLMQICYPLTFAVQLL